MSAPLAFDIEGAGPLVVLAHGFTQTRRCWGVLRGVLARWYTVMSVDLPGHGDSSDVRASLEEGARLLGAVGGRAHYVGYSMGARHVLALAADQPELVRSAFLIGVHPGIEDSAERSHRKAEDDQRADEIERVGVETFLEAWLRLPLFAGLDEESAHLDERLENTAAGLAASLRLAGTGTQEPLWGRLSDITAPVALVAGANDERYVRIGTRAAAECADARFTPIAGAGHAAHLERPHAFLRALLPWLRAQTQAESESAAQ